MLNKALPVALAASLFLSACGGIAPFGAMSLAMIEPPIGGRPLTFSPTDGFFCVDTDKGGEIYRVPYLYVSDQSSIPSAALPLIDALGYGGSLNPQFSRAAVLHDFLYAIGTPGDRAAQERADNIFFELQRAEGIKPAVIGAMKVAFAAVRLSAPPENPYGNPDEWKRWADPITLRYLAPAMRPVKSEAKSLVVTLSNCKVFDDGRSPKSRRLQACLHTRYMSTRDLAFWPSERQAPRPPIIPWSLEDLSTPKDIAAYLAGDCRRYQ